MSLKPVWATMWDLIWKENKAKKQILPADKKKIVTPPPAANSQNSTVQDGRMVRPNSWHTSRLNENHSKVLIGITHLEDLSHAMESAIGNFPHGSEPGKQLWLEFIHQSQPMRTPHGKESLELIFFFPFRRDGVWACILNAALWGSLAPTACLLKTRGYLFPSSSVSPK